MTPSRLSLTEAVDLTRTGDLWLFRGNSVADRAIRTATNSPVNHVGMAVVLEDLPPLMWHAELGRSLPDVWTGNHQRGVQLHDLRDSVTLWSTKYAQRAWLRQLEIQVTREMEDALLQVVARLDGTPFPSTVSMVGGYLKGHGETVRDRLLRRRRDRDRTDGAATSLETAYCAEVVATSYQAMGLLAEDRPANWYDPGRFWSGDTLHLEGGAVLGKEIEVVT